MGNSNRKEEENKKTFYRKADKTTREFSRTYLNQAELAVVMQNKASYQNHARDPINVVLSILGVKDGINIARPS